MAPCSKHELIYRYDVKDFIVVEFNMTKSLNDVHLFSEATASLNLEWFQGRKPVLPS
jgi:hypothetical protein